MQQDKQCKGVTIGIVGYGSAGKKHLKILKDLRPKNRHIVMSKHASPEEVKKDGAVLVRSIESLVSTSPRIVLICTDAASHGCHIVRLCNSGAKVVIEKPLAAKLTQSTLIIEQTNEIVDRPVVAYNLRFSKGLQKLKLLLDGGIIGDVLCVNVIVGQALEKWRLGRDLSTTVSASRSLGGGVLRELSHELDYLNYLFGHPLHALGFTGQQRFDEFDVEDSAMLLLKYRGAKIPILVSLAMDFIRWDDTRRCTVVGEKGTVIWDLLEGQLSHLPKHKASRVLMSDHLDVPSSSRLMLEKLLGFEYDEFCDLTTACKHLEIIEKIEQSQDEMCKLGDVT